MYTYCEKMYYSSFVFEFSVLLSYMRFHPLYHSPLPHSVCVLLGIHFHCHFCGLDIALTVTGTTANTIIVILTFIIHFTVILTFTVIITILTHQLNKRASWGLFTVLFTNSLMLCLHDKILDLTVCIVRVCVLHTLCSCGCNLSSCIFLMAFSCIVNTSTFLSSPPLLRIVSSSCFFSRAIYSSVEMRRIVSSGLHSQDLVTHCHLQFSLL